MYAHSFNPYFELTRSKSGNSDSVSAMRKRKRYDDVFSK
jgi:hypothetical protein